jgi:predicted ATPase
MNKRIDEHFSAAAEAITHLSFQGEPMILDYLLIVPLIQRTNSMVQFARELEDGRKKLFSPLERYEQIVSSFLNKKSVEVSENGNLVIQSLAQKGQNLETHLLSSGEKQIVILLTQALLWEDKPVVYVADEPELSLHVSWQEKLLKSLQELGGRIQIIVATHSPDVAGPFPNKVIDLEKV